MSSIVQATAHQAGEDQPPRPVLWTNFITLAGLLIVGFSVLLLLTFWLFVAITPEHSQNEYLNIVGYLVLPGILVTGLIMCPVGILIRRRRLRNAPNLWQITPRQAMIFLAVTFFFTLPILGVASYQGYHYSESTEFCGSCHSVMDPQYLSHQQSPHARVTCAECHIGSGASPFVKSKISGTRQLFAVAFNTFPRPIPPAITQLRPSRETCETCHWPDRFYGSKLKPLVRFAPDEQNTRHELEILLKVGGRDTYLGRAEGIHMHMIGRVEYIATDEGLQTIPWVRYRNEDGTTTIYRSDGKSANDPPPEGHLRLLDCMDCHNRAGHNFTPPQESVDLALNARLIDPTLPFIKREAVSALAQPYQTRDEAMEGIEKSIRDFYQANYPHLLEQRGQEITGAIRAIQKIFENTIFPEMKTDWRSHPNNIGHLVSPGCYRCHDGYHVDDNGRAITSDCNTCHTFLYRDPNDPSKIVEGKFRHEMKIHDLWEGLGPHKNLQCQVCHTGALTSHEPMLSASACGDCHPSGRWLELREKSLFRETPPAPAAETSAAPAGSGELR